MASVFFVIGLSLAGAVNLGAGLMALGSGDSRRGHLGAFGTGALAALVAAPCTAPFMGAALGYAVTGTPADCVKIGIGELAGGPVDLVVSGINPNANIGHDVTYSGTVTAAMEAAIGGVCGVAVSLDAPEYFNGLLDYSAAAVAARVVTTKMLNLDLPKNILLNVNVPYLPLAGLKGYRISRQGLRIYRDELVKREDPRGRPYYWIGGEAPTGVPETGTDFGDLQDGYVSITPIQLDLTAHDLLARLRDLT